MCFSAKVKANPRDLAKDLGGKVDLTAFERLYARRSAGEKLKTPKAMDDALAVAGAGFDRLSELVEGYNAAQAALIEKELFTQKTRLTNAERALATKPTKKAADDQRIASDKIERARVRLSDLRRTEPKDRDSRIFPGVYAPVVVEEGGQRWVRPMRYGCRLAGKPANYDQRFPGTYNARRDNLEGFWRAQFGRDHALLVVERFFENVERIDEDGKSRNVVLEFRPAPAQDMLVACLWSRWIDPKGLDPDLLSFAAITDEPPAEVAAAGHDRCIVQIDPENVCDWLAPGARDRSDLQSVLDDRPRPFYEHREAA